MLKALDWGRLSTATSTSRISQVQRSDGWIEITWGNLSDPAALVAHQSSTCTAMVRRWHADPLGFLRPWGELPALLGSAPPATPPSTGTGVITFIMG